MAKRKSKNSTIVSVTVMQRLRLGQIFYSPFAGAVQAFIVTHPIIDRGGIDIFKATQYPNAIYSREFFPGDLGMVGYAYDDRPCCIQPTAELARIADKKYDAWLSHTRDYAG